MAAPPLPGVVVVAAVPPTNRRRALPAESYLPPLTLTQSVTAKGTATGIATGTVTADTAMTATTGTATAASGIGSVTSRVGTPRETETATVTVNATATLLVAGAVAKKRTTIHAATAAKTTAVGTAGKKTTSTEGLGRRPTAGIGEEEGGTVTGWGRQSGGRRLRRRRLLCRKGSGRQAGGTCMPLGTSSTRPCRLNRQVSRHWFSHAVLLACGRRRHHSPPLVSLAV